MKKNLVKPLLLIAVGAVFVYSFIQVYKYFDDTGKAVENTRKLAKAALIQKPDKDGEEGCEDIDFDVLKNHNPDIIAWIVCENTPLNYPVVQGEDNEWYLNHLTNGEVNVCGTVFADFRASSDFSDRNTVLYGHNMKNGEMFACLFDWKSADFYSKHETMKLFSPNKTYSVEIFSVFETDVYSEIYSSIYTDEQTQSFIDLCRSKSLVKTDVVPTVSDKFLTLSTCSDNSDKRFAVVGVLK